VTWTGNSSGEFVPIGSDADLTLHPNGTRTFRAVVDPFPIVELADLITATHPLAHGATAEVFDATRPKAAAGESIVAKRLCALTPPTAATTWSGLASCAKLKTKS
jgi:hypothetical protein